MRHGGMAACKLHAVKDSCDVRTQVDFYTISAQWSLIWETLSPHNMESIEFRLCAPLLCLFVWLSIFSIWLLCQQYNQYNKPSNIYQPSAWPEGRDTTTIHEWEVTQLWPLIQGYLFQLLERDNASVTHHTQNEHVKNNILQHRVDNWEATHKVFF